MTLKKCRTGLDKILEYSLYGLAFFIPISIAAVEIFTATAIVAFVLKSLLGRKLQRQATSRGSSFFTPSNILLLLFFIFCALSLINSGTAFPKALNALFGKWGKFIMLYWVAADSLGRGEGRLKKILIVFLASAALVVIDAYSQKLFGLEFLLHRSMIEVKYAGRIEFAVTGAFKHSNTFATYLICAIPLLAGTAVAVQRLSSAQKTLMRTLYGYSLLTVIFLLSFCLVLTFSRGGWLGLIVAGILMLFLVPRKRFFLLLGAVFLLLIFVLPGASERVVASFRTGGDSLRYELWDGAWAMIAEHPFIGKGVGTFMAFFQDYVQGRGAMYAHNCFLQMWAEVGVFGLLSFLMFLGAVLRGGFLAIRQSADGEMAAVLAGLLCGVVAFLVQSSLDTNLYSLQPSAMFWLFLGMIQVLSRTAKGTGLRKQSSPVPA